MPVEPLTASLEGLLAQGGLDVSAAHSLADRIGASHARAPRGDFGQFMATLDRLATLPAQKRELERHFSHLERRASGGRVRKIDAFGSADVLFALAHPLATLIRTQSPPPPPSCRIDTPM